MKTLKTIEKLNTSNVVDMSNMFNGATSFNQDISSWVIQQDTDTSNMFLNASAMSNENYCKCIEAWNRSDLGKNETCH